MNWVGGSRTRVLIKQDRRKQKEYFERNKLKSKMKLLGAFSPVKNSTVSLDLLNLYMVNQISRKKKTSETMKRPTHVNMNRDIKIPPRKHDLELPMSPNCIPSKLCIDDVGNSITYQELGRKAESGPAQLSQDMNSYEILEPAFNKREKCSYTLPAFSAELSSNRQILKQNLPPRAVSNPQEFAYKRKQFSNGKCFDPLVSNLNEHQDVFSSLHKITQFETLFERKNSPENGDFLPKRNDRTMNKNCQGLNERRPPDFTIEEQSAQHVWGTNGKDFFKFLEDVNQPTQRLLSVNHDTFIGQSMINLLSMDQQRIKETFSECDIDSVGDIFVASSDGNHYTDGTLYTDGYIKGKHKNDDQEKTLQKSTQEYPVCSLGDIPFQEWYPKQSCNFGSGEILMEGRRRCSLKQRPLSTKKIYMESSQSSQSASYSPRTTDSCFSSSSDMLSEDEDQILQIEESKCPDNKIVKDDSQIHKQFSVKTNTDQSPLSLCNSGHILQNKVSNKCIIQVVRCDAGVQTDGEPTTGGKLDVAIQCNIISKCACRHAVSSGYSIESSSENIKADTTGGQEILKNS